MAEVAAVMMVIVKVEMEMLMEKVDVFGGV